MAEGDNVIERGAFAIDDLWRTSIFTIDDDDDFAGRPFDDYGLDSKGRDTFPSVIIPLSSHLTLPNLETFQYGPLNNIPVPGSVTASSELESLELDAEEDGDIWLTYNDGSVGTPESIPRTWESFYDSNYTEPTRHLSELGSGAFDALLEKTHSLRQPTDSQRHIFKHEPTLFALKLLGLGYSSWLFECGSSQEVFHSRFQVSTVSGLSQPLTESLTAFFAESGANFKSLWAFADSKSSKASSSTVVALAKSISNVLEEISFTASAAATSARTLLELQMVYQQPSGLLRILRDLAGLAQDGSNGIVIMTRIYDFLCQNEFNLLWARPVLLAILDRVTGPWLDAMSCCLGLKHSTHCDQRLVARIENYARDRTEDQDIQATESVIPPFISEQDRNLMLETCNSLSLLRKYDQNCSLLNPDSLHSLQIRWIFTEDDLRNNIAIIKEREASPGEKLAAHGQAAAPTASLDTAMTYGADETRLDPYGHSDTLMENLWDQAAALVQQLPGSLRHNSEDKLAKAVRSCFSTNSEEINQLLCPLSLAPHLAFAPVVESQHRILGQACLRMLFRNYNLREHLLLQRRFQLFADGSFASHLSQALFSGDLSAIKERQDHSQAGNHGLRLGDRSTWPPGGSELRLVLMGILSESYYGSYDTIGSRNKDLPGNLSFGIRHLSESEIEAVMDPHSLTALDFLRLQYTAPPPLDAILTESAMEKYDCIFKFLLRVSRLLAVTNQMAPSRWSGPEDPTSTLFRIAASRFIEALSGYFLDAAIALPWTRFEASLAALDASFDANSGAKSNVITSVLELRAAHYATLDAMLFSLLLRRRQAPVLRLLEEIFSLILDFARIRSYLGGSAQTKAEVRELYDTFRAKTNTFVTVCRGLSEKKGYTIGTTGERVEGGGIDELVLRLDMNGWWTKQ